MRIEHLFKYYWPDPAGGIARAMDLAILSFKEWTIDKNRQSQTQNKNYQEIITCWQKSNKPAKKDMYNGINVLRCKSLLDFASTQFSLQFVRVLDKRSKEADVTIYNFPYPVVDLAILFGKVHGKLVVWWHCDFETSHFGWLQYLYRPLVNNTLKKAEKIITCAEGNIRGSKILSKYGEKCVVIPHAVDDWWAEAGEKEYAKWLSNPCDSNDINIVFVGRFVWYKGIEFLLKAYSQLKGKNFTLTLVGAGPLLLEMKKLASELKLEGVSFVGAVSDEEKFMYISRSDFMVLPSISEAESFANVQIEAMAVGKPVINTWLNSGVPDVCPDGVSGITVHPENVEELREAIQLLSDDWELRKKYSIGAMKYAREHYRMDRVIESYKNFYDEICRDLCNQEKII